MQIVFVSLFAFPIFFPTPVIIFLETNTFKSPPYFQQELIKDPQTYGKQTVSTVLVVFLIEFTLGRIMQLGVTIKL